MRSRILVTLLLACGTAQASNWVSLGKSDDGTIEPLVDVSSVRVAGSIRRAWIKHVFKTHTTRGDGVDATKWQSESVARVAFSCSEETFRLEGLLIYYDDGTTNSVPATSFPTPWQPIPPDTVRGSEMHFVCAWGKK